MALARIAITVLGPVRLGEKRYLDIRDQAFRKIVLSLLTASGMALPAAPAPLERPG